MPDPFTPWITGDSPTNLPRVDVNVEASVEYLEAHSQEDLKKLAQGIISQNTGDLRQFVTNQRRQAAEGRYARVFRSYPGLEMDYQQLAGREHIRLTVKPEAVGESPEQPSGLLFDVNAEFTGWPILHYQTRPGVVTGYQYGNYSWDAAFVPTLPTETNQNIPSLSNNSALWNQVFGRYNESINTGNFFDDFLASPGENNGFIEQWWTTKVSGFGITDTALSGKEYFEVEIRELPSNTPAPLTLNLSGQYDGTYEESDTFYQDKTIMREQWPADMNTFVNPAIGLLPEHYRDPNRKGNYVTFGTGIGLDTQLVPVARTLGLIRSKRRPSLNTIVNFAYGYWYYHTIDQNYIAAHGGDDVVEVVGIQDNPYIGPPETIDLRFNNWYGTDNVLFNANGGPGPALTDANQADWDNVFTPGTPIYIPGTTINNLYARVGPFNITQVADKTKGNYHWNFSVNYSLPDPEIDDVFGTIDHNYPDYLVRPGKFTTNAGTGIIGDVYVTSDNLDHFGNLITTGLNATGEHFQAILGRPDLMTSIQPMQTTPIDTPDQFGNIWNACYSGVDLGAINKNDTIMVATDTKTREVWFGKNGKWYDKSGETKKQPGQKDFPGALLMDGDEKTKYYPACSFRLGPTKLRMKFVGVQKFFPPGGFEAYPAGFKVK